MSIIPEEENGSPVDKKYPLPVYGLAAGFVCHRLIQDQSGKVSDFIFSEVNPAFEKMIGADREVLIGQSISHVKPRTQYPDFDWHAIYEAAMASSRAIRQLQHSEPLNRWYDITAYSYKPGFYACLIQEVNPSQHQDVFHQSLLQINEELLNLMSGSAGFEVITNTMLKLSGARIVALNTYESNGSLSVTRSIAGVDHRLRDAAKILGFNALGKEWPINPERIRNIKSGKLITYNNLNESSMGAMGEKTCYLIDKTFGLGENCVIELATQDQPPAGDIIFFMPQGKHVQNVEMIEMYASQLSAVLYKLRAEQKLAISESNFRLITENIEEVVWLRDANNRQILYISPAYEKVWGRSRESLIQNPDILQECIHEKDRSRVNKAMSLYKKSGTFNLEYRIVTPEGHHKWIWARSMPVRNSSGGVIYHTGIATDITQRKINEEEMVYMSFHDSLTGLYNRRFVEKEMQRLDTGRQLPMCLLMADTNKLKVVNDTLGHCSGDEMIKKCADILRRAVRKEDIVGRWGGDEFLVLLPRTKIQQAQKIIDRISKLSKSEFVKHINVSMAVGVACKSELETPIPVVITEAENKMYQDKPVE